jgi:hypothetical protein
MNQEQYKAGIGNGIKLGVMKERKRIANLLMGQVCADYQIDAVCKHTVCAGYFDVAQKLGFGEHEACFYQCTNCENRSPLIIHERGFDHNTSCPRCAKKMVKEIYDEQI